MRLNTISASTVKKIIKVDKKCTSPNVPPDKNPGLAAKRQKKVVRSMVKYGCISEAEGEDILAHKR